MRKARQVAFRNAARIIQETGATAVKLEGGTRMAETIHYLTQRGIPVMGHIGLTPQIGECHGRLQDHGPHRGRMAGACMADAQAVAEAGAFAVVLEGMAEPLAARITGRDRHSHHRHRRSARPATARFW